MADQMKVQTVLITHHKVDEMGMYSVELKEDPVYGVRVELPMGMPLWEKGQKGIRSVTLENVMSHGLSTKKLWPL